MKASRKWGFLHINIYLPKAEGCKALFFPGLSSMQSGLLSFVSFVNDFVLLVVKKMKYL